MDLDSDSDGSVDPDPGRPKFKKRRKTSRNFMFEEFSVGPKCPLWGVYFVIKFRSRSGSGFSKFRGYEALVKSYAVFLVNFLILILLSK